MSGKKPTRVRTMRKHAIINKGSGTGTALSQIGRSNMINRCIGTRNKMFRTFHQLYNLPLFTSLYNDDKLSENQREMLRSLSSLRFKNKIESYKYDSTTPYCIVHLKQSDFSRGTVRITQPGIYVLTEDITFHPNPENDFQPLAQDVSSGRYPIPGPYQLGFFAAITIESKDVILDLNGHTLQQSKEHYLQQRFYANIELGSSPFIKNQGPSNGITGAYQFPTNITVMNGKIGLSSHHGLHGNLGTQVLLYNLYIDEFQVAGIALNGFTESILCDLYVTNTTGVRATSIGVPINFQYSQGRFIRSFLQSLQKNVPDAELVVDGTSIGVGAIIQELNDAMEKTRVSVLENKYDEIPDVFKNETRLSDGNVYGILLHIQGVAVNGFVDERTASDGNGNDTIYLKNITIKNIKSSPEETVVVMKYESENGDFGYNNKNIVKGPVGDVFDVRFNSQNGAYKANVLANAQLILGKYSLKEDNTSSFGTTYFHNDVIDWVEQRETNIDEIVADCPDDDSHDKSLFEGKLVYKYGLDAMAHVMKGNFGLFVSGGRNIKTTNVDVNGATVPSNETLPHKDGTKDVLIVSSQNIEEVKKNANYGTIAVL